VISDTLQILVFLVATRHVALVRKFVGMETEMNQVIVFLKARPLAVAAREIFDFFVGLLDVFC
jgi:hypothetical protein